MKMPASTFPLSKQRKFCVRACARWRVAKFFVNGKEYRLLVVYRPDFERYSAYLGLCEAGDTCVLARYEYSATHRGWHMHCNCKDGALEFGRTGVLNDRIPGGYSHHRNRDFGIDDDDQAVHVAAKKFGLIGKQLLEMQ
jgi:hypothetical protein